MGSTMARQLNMRWGSCVGVFKTKRKYNREFFRKFSKIKGKLETSWNVSKLINNDSYDSYS